MEALVQMVVSPPQDTDEKTRFKYVLYGVHHCCLLLVMSSCVADS